MDTQLARLIEKLLDDIDMKYHTDEMTNESRAILIVEAIERIKDERAKALHDSVPSGKHFADWGC